MLYLLNFFYRVAKNKDLTPVREQKNPPHLKLNQIQTNEIVRASQGHTAIKHPRLLIRKPYIPSGIFSKIVNSKPSVISHSQPIGEPSFGPMADSRHEAFCEYLNNENNLERPVLDNYTETRPSSSSIYMDDVDCKLSDNEFENDQNMMMFSNNSNLPYSHPRDEYSGLWINESVNMTQSLGTCNSKPEQKRVYTRHRHLQQSHYSQQ